VGGVGGELAPPRGFGGNGPSAGVSGQRPRS